MASVTLRSVIRRFPVGTSVKAYAVSNFPATWRNGALPSGLTEAATATVQSDGSLTFTGLTQDAAYRAYALIDTDPRYIGFMAKDEEGGSSDPISVRPLPSGDTSGATDVAAINAALAVGDVLLRGTYYVNAPIQIPSSRSLWLWDATINLTNGAACNIINNSACNSVVYTTIAAGSNGQALPQATINLASTAGLPSSGTVQIGTSLNQVTYTGLSGNSLTGCTGGTGTMSTGNGVVLHAPDTNIALHCVGSVILNGNAANQGALQSAFWRNNGVCFWNVQGLTITGRLQIQYTRYDAMEFLTCTDVNCDTLECLQDAVVPNMGGFAFRYGTRRVRIKEVTGTSTDDFLLFRNGNGQNAVHGISTPGLPGGTVFDIDISRLSGRVISAGTGNTVRFLTGDGEAISTIRIGSIFETLTAISTVKFGEAQYVTTPPAAADLTQISIGEIFSRGGTQGVMVFDSSCSQVTVGRITVTNTAPFILGNNAASAQTIQDLTVRSIHTSRSVITDVMKFGTGVTVTRPKVGPLVVGGNLASLLNNAATVTSLAMRGVDIETLTTALVRSSTPETGLIGDVVVGGLSGAQYLSAQSRLVISGAFPVLSSADTLPQPVSGSRIQCDTTLDPTGAGGTNAGVYVGNGEQWIRQVDLGGWNPGLYGALAFDYDAASIAASGNPANGAAISSWSDGARIAGALVQATGSKQPTYVATDAKVSNKPTVQFDGTDDFVQLAALPNAIAQPFLLVIVFYLRSLPAGGAEVVNLANASNTNDARILMLDATTFEAIAGSTVVLGSTPVANTAALVWMRFNGTSTIWGLNKLYASGTTISPGTFGGHSVTLGARYDGTTRPAPINIARVFAYSGAPSPTVMPSILAGASGLYGITLT